MVRISKQAERRQVSFRRTRKPAVKTGAKKDALPKGFKEHKNTLQGESAQKAFIPSIQ